jgi:NAD+ synthase (glutamine-hydrolysing)
VRRNDASSVTLGLSGGIDAAVTAAIAADALGAENVLGIAMPAPGTPPEELEDARQLAAALGIRFETIPLREPTSIIASELTDVLDEKLEARARDSLQSRMRTAVLWAVCDQEGHLPLATGNKSELSIGTASLHGDMAGAFAPLKDCPKTLLYRLARLRNERRPVIPARTLERTPTSQAIEGAGGPPPFEVLDEIVERYVEHGDSIEELRAAGFDGSVVRGVLQLVDAAELKRRQTPPGVKITARAFGQDLRMPITSAWRPYREEEAEVAPPQPAAAPDIVS